MELRYNHKLLVFSRIKIYQNQKSSISIDMNYYEFKGIVGLILNNLQFILASINI